MIFPLYSRRDDDAGLFAFLAARGARGCPLIYLRGRFMMITTRQRCVKVQAAAILHCCQAAAPPLMARSAPPRRGSCRMPPFSCREEYYRDDGFLAHRVSRL